MNNPNTDYASLILFGWKKYLICPCCHNPVDKETARDRNYQRRVNEWMRDAVHYEGQVDWSRVDLGHGQYPKSINWNEIDWSKNNTQIAKETGVNRETVGDIRWTLRHPNG